MNPLQVFTFEGSAPVSAVMRGGEAWFLASEVCAALGLDPTATRRLDEDEKGLHSMQTPGGIQRIGMVNECGLYHLAFTSRKASAQRFRKWVTSVVLPSIRVHGGYVKGMEELQEASQAATVQAIRQEVKRVGLCLAEEKEARASALRFLRR